MTKPKFTIKELHDLYDMMYMMEAGIIKINGIQKSYNSIFEKLEKYCIAGKSLVEKENKR